MGVRVLAVAVALAAALAGCDRGADSGASGRPEPVAGTSGRGTADTGGGRPAQPGSGLQGGLGASNGTSAMGAGADQATQGSTNRTPSNSVGRR